MTNNNMSKAAQIIREGGLVAFPTETVYGLGANALDPYAVAKIFALKERPSFDPLIVHIASFDDLEQLTSGTGENVVRLAKHFWPGPLTIVLPKSDKVPDIVTSGLPTVGIRMPDNPTALELIRSSGCPIAAPSANKFGQLSPVSASHVKKQLPNVDYVLDGGATSVGIESTIVSIEGDTCQLLRPGFITQEDIEQAFPGTFVFNQSKPEKLVSPGLLKSHYSPKKPLYILNEAGKSLPEASGLILHSATNNAYTAGKVIYTSQTGNMVEVAANLFAALHTMEEDAHVKNIFIEPVVEKGLGMAIMDRVKKAAYQYNNHTN
ncbi:threonylcarbamoyl-AMP synthase [Maribellus sp. CM-23]|uniref:L-threonylcarbamoyladenylate synthase n=1 Tax=Maribellus sp. CM-23 TaxID=2781026 RepID=UPI001F24FD72|nr:L-threonylcarbamoyladenylate synthase [Maribellus sp. CM-23]MCE4565118.1 threonylcarbamoyl-AMP synthase [Maribellus sp. CM-23]